MAEMFDLVIRGGTIIDGSGGDPIDGDIAVQDGQVTEIGKILGRGREEIDAKGALVTPGFVDVHTHYDGQAVWARQMSPSSEHGITTVIAGNCGVGFAPCRPEHREMLIHLMEGVEDIPEAVMTNGLTWDWESFPDYMAALDRRPRDIDIGLYMPHSPMRVYVMGERAARREAAREDDLRRMEVLTREAMQAGAFGFSTSRTIFQRSSTGEQIPSYDAAEAELQAISGAVADAGKGIVQIVTDYPGRPFEEELGLLARLSEKSGCVMTFLMGQVSEAPDEWRDVMGLVDEVNARPGVKLVPQVLPRPTGIVVGLNASTHPFRLCPTYESIAHLPLEAKVREMRRPEVRKRLLAEAPADSRNLLYSLGRRFEVMFEILDPPNYEQPMSQSVLNRAARMGVPPEELAYDLLLKNEGESYLYLALSNYGHGNLDACLPLVMHKDTVLGLGDGGAHCGLICDASYTTFMLTHWTRDRAGEKMSLPSAVKAMAHDTAALMGLHDRGLLRPGLKADLNIIDYDRLQLRAPHIIQDLPGGGKRLAQHADGYIATIVSGQVTYREGRSTGVWPGRVLRSPAHAGTRRLVTA